MYLRLSGICERCVIIYCSECVGGDALYENQVTVKGAVLYEPWTFVTYTGESRPLTIPRSPF